MVIGLEILQGGGALGSHHGNGELSAMEACVGHAGRDVHLRLRSELHLTGPVPDQR